MKKLMLGAIRWYQNKLSPKKGHPTCRFYPTCSQYAYEAIEGYGAFFGLMLAIGRLVRCNPLFKGGYNPVPERILFGKIKKKSR